MFIFRHITASSTDIKGVHHHLTTRCQSLVSTLQHTVCLVERHNTPDVYQCHYAHFPAFVTLTFEGSMLLSSGMPSDIYYQHDSLPNMILLLFEL